MADQIDAQERLAAVDELISTCETTAIEIEGQFEQFEGSLTETEGKCEELISDLETTSSEVIEHTNEIESQLIDDVTSLSTQAITFAATMNGIVETIQSESEGLFGKFDEMDSAYQTMRNNFDENAEHMRTIFQNLGNTWTEVNDLITSLQDQRQSDYQKNIHELSDEQIAAQADQQSNAQGVLSQLYNDVMVDNAQTHLNTVYDTFTTEFEPNLERLSADNRSLQENVGQNFAQFRGDTLSQMMSNTENLFSLVDGVMNTMTTTTSITSNIADVTVTAMDQTNVGLNQLNEAIENVISMLGTLSLD